jgi:PAS domain S-box-containing protein
MNQSLDNLAKLTQELAAAEQAKYQLQSEFDTLFNLCPDMLCIASPDGWFKRVNPSFERVLGWTPEKLMSCSFLDLIHPDDKIRTSEEIVRLLGDYDSKDFRNRYLCVDGSYQMIEWRSQKDHHGMIYACGRALAST